MDIEKVLESHESRLQNLENARAEITSRLGKVEDKASGAWKTIGETRGEVADLRKEVDELKKDVKEMKSMQDSAGKTLKILVGVVAGLCVVVGGFLVYIWKHDAELAKSILGLGSMIGNIIA